jgi:hypothetical protein
MTSINSQINGMKIKITSVIEINSHELQYILHIIDYIVGFTNKHDKIEYIEQLLKILKAHINFFTIQYLNRVGLNPPPPFLMPPKGTYDRSIIRQPGVTPINPKKLLIGGSVVIDQNANNLDANALLAQQINELNQLKYGI